MFDGSDDLRFTVYAGKQAYPEVEEIMTDMIGMVEKKKAGTHELEKLIELYFNAPEVGKS